MKKVFATLAAITFAVVLAAGSVTTIKAPHPRPVSADPQPQCDPSIPECNPAQ